MTRLTFGSLFAGIGGLDLGFERAGLRCVWQVEKNDYARRVLEKHWPDVRRHDDVCTFPAEPAGDWRCDVICGGFPCQDISNAGKRAGIYGRRSGLWAEFARIIRVLRPRFVVVENVSALLVRGFDRVLANLAACGYDAEWFVLPAYAVGAPHIRERVFVVAHSERIGGSLWDTSREQSGRPTSSGYAPDTDSISCEENRGGLRASLPCGWRPQPGSADLRDDIPYADVSGLAIRQIVTGDARSQLAAFKRANRERGGQWAIEPGVGRVANGVPDRVDRLTGLGNAVVPQVAEWIGRRLVEFTT